MSILLLINFSCKLEVADDSEREHSDACFAGVKWQEHFEDLKTLQKILSKNPKKLKLIHDFLGNLTPT